MHYLYHNYMYSFSARIMYFVKVGIPSERDFSFNVLRQGS